MAVCKNAHANIWPTYPRLQERLLRSSEVVRCLAAMQRMHNLRLGAICTFNRTLNFAFHVESRNVSRRFKARNFSPQSLRQVAEGLLTKTRFENKYQMDICKAEGRRNPIKQKWHAIARLFFQEIREGDAGRQKMGSFIRSITKHCANNTFVFAGFCIGFYHRRVQATV